jgi:hypothetical protein
MKNWQRTNDFLANSFIFSYFLKTTIIHQNQSFNFFENRQVGDYILSLITNGYLFLILTKHYIKDYVEHQCAFNHQT